MTTTRSFSASAWASARLIASTINASATSARVPSISARGAIEELRTVRGVDIGVQRGDRSRLGFGYHLVDALQRFSRGLLFRIFVPQTASFEVRPQARQWIACAPLVDLVGRLVAARVVGRRMGADAIRQ